MLTLEETTMHPRHHFKEGKFNGANLSKHEFACSYNKDKV